MGRVRLRSDEEQRYRAGLTARIREVRKLRGLSALEVQRRSGIHRNVLSLYERARMMPSAFSLLRLARALDVSRGQLLGRLESDAREPMVCSPGATMGTEMLDPELRNRVASGKTGQER